MDTRRTNKESIRLLVLSIFSKLLFCCLENPYDYIPTIMTIETPATFLNLDVTIKRLLFYFMYCQCNLTCVLEQLYSLS